LPVHLHRIHLHLLLKQEVRLLLLSLHSFSIPSRGGARSDQNYSDNEEYDSKNDPDNREEENQSEQEQEDANHYAGDAGHEGRRERYPLIIPACNNASELETLFDAHRFAVACLRSNHAATVTPLTIEPIRGPPNSCPDVED
jgi:hypothetical protein